MNKGIMSIKAMSNYTVNDYNNQYIRDISVKYLYSNFMLYFDE